MFLDIFLCKYVQIKDYSQQKHHDAAQIICTTEAQAQQGILRCALYQSSFEWSSQMISDFARNAISPVGRSPSP